MNMTPSPQPIDLRLISLCAYCTMISEDPKHKTPISCTKLSGSNHPIHVNPAACFSCEEYKKCLSVEFSQEAKPS